MKKYVIKDNQGNKKTIYAENITHAIKTIKDDENLHSINKSKMKDARLKITFKNSDDFDEIDTIAKHLHLGLYETRNNQAILEGARKNLEKYVDLVWGGDPSIKRLITEGGYSSEDSKVKDVRLEKGDWFTYREAWSPHVFKVISTINNTNKDYSKEVVVEEYNIDFSSSDYRIIKSGTSTVRIDSSKIVRFNSANEAINWLKRQRALNKASYNKYHSNHDSAKYSKITDALDVEGYANYGLRIKEQLPYDLFYDGHRKGLDFNAVLKNYDSIAKQILAKIKEYLYDAKKTLISFKKY